MRNFEGLHSAGRAAVVSRGGRARAPSRLQADLVRLPTAHPTAIDRANELGMEVVEVGRCPIYYLDDAPMACRGHTMIVRLSGTRKRPPQNTLDKKQRIMW